MDDGSLQHTNPITCSPNYVRNLLASRLSSLIRRLDINRADL